MKSIFSTRRICLPFGPVANAGVLIFALLAAAGCGTSLTLTSQWADQDTKVDGNSSDWSSFPTRIAGPDVYVAVKNDNESLYLCLTTASRSTQFQMLTLGTTIWLDTEGKKNKTLGIKFPLPGLSQGRRLPTSANADDTKLFIDRLIAAAQNQFEIIGPKPEDRKRFTTRESHGIDVRLGYEDGTLTYELKIPLMATPELQHSIGVDRSKPFAVGLETGDFSEAMRTQMGAAAAPAGGGGRSGGRGGRGSGGGGGASGIPGTNAPEGLKHWITVHLQTDVPVPTK